jgi:hypothetical protein
MPILELTILAGMGALALRDALKAKANGGVAPEPAPGTYPMVSMDSRIVPGTPLGLGPTFVSGCPHNPPPPTGFDYWPGNVSVSAAIGAWAVHVRNAYPIGTFIEDVVGGELVAARIEYHTLQGATGKTGCFKGLNLLRRKMAPA